MKPSNPCWVSVLIRWFWLVLSLRICAPVTHVVVSWPQRIADLSTATSRGNILANRKQSGVRSFKCSKNVLQPIFLWLLLFWGNGALYRTSFYITPLTGVRKFRMDCKLYELFLNLLMELNQQKALNAWQTVSQLICYRVIAFSRVHT